jgi:hypothetical protein
MELIIDTGSSDLWVASKTASGFNKGSKCSFIIISQTI